MGVLCYVGKMDCHIPVKKGVSENQAVEYTIFPTFWATILAGLWNSISKQINTPNFSPKSVSKVTVSFPADIVGSSKGFIFRYL